MVKGRCSLLVLIILMFVLPVVTAAPADESESLFSPLTAGIFHKMAYELYTLDDAGQGDFDEAKAFLDASRELDSGAEYLNEDMLVLGSLTASDDDFDLMLKVFNKYVNEKADFEVMKKAVRYFLGTVDSRQEREELLIRLYTIVQKKNPVLASELAAELGQLSLEKADIEAAKGNFQHAYALNKYNSLAFARFDELLRKEGKELPAAAYVINLRRMMDVDPHNFDAALTFAQYCERVGVYDVSAEAYGYAASLFEYLSPDRDLPDSIYLPWSMTSYNTKMFRANCLDIARKVQQSGRFDLRTEALAGLAAKSMGNITLGEEILKNAGSEAEKKLGSAAVSNDVTALQLAWFYSFVVPSNDRSLAWSNRAFSADPNAPGAKAMFGYALAINEQYDIAETYLMEVGNDQIATLTKAVVQLANSENEKDKGVETLKSCIAMDPLSLAAIRAREILVSNGSEYIAGTSPELIKVDLKKEFGGNIIGKFMPAKDIFSARLKVSGSQFSYDSDIKANLIITNKSTNPILISDRGLFKGNIRVDAEVRGDVTRRFPELISKRVTPSMPIEPGDYVSIELDLNTGTLARLLQAFPQASVEIEFRVYLDPIVDDSGDVRHSIADMGPVWTIIKRPRVELTRQFLMQRLDALSRGQEGQKIRAARLFVGLLVEQDFMGKAKPMYRYIHVERPLLVDAVKRSVVDKNWKVRVQATDALAMWPKRIDYQVTQVISGSLNDSHWPVRMMALYVLSKSQGQEFQQVIDWSAKYDSKSLVRNMAVALGGSGTAVPSVNAQEDSK